MLMMSRPLERNPVAPCGSLSLRLPSTSVPSIADFLLAYIPLQVRCMTSTMRRNSFNVLMGTQSMILFRHWREKFLTKNGTKGRIRIKRSAVGVNLRSASAYSLVFSGFSASNVYPSAA